MTLSGAFDARTTLTGILGLLPAGLWFKVLQESTDETGIATATGQKYVEINALLVNAGIAKEVKARGMTNATKPQLVKDELDKLIGGLEDIQAVPYQNKQYICRGAPRFKNAGKQLSGLKREKLKKAVLPDKLIEQLGTSTTIYNSSKDQQKANEKAAAEKRKRADAAAAAAKKAQAVQHPLLAKILGRDATAAITLADDNVQGTVKALAAEIAQLHLFEDRTITYTSPKGTDMTLLPVPKCSDRESFEAYDRKSNWTSDLIRLSCRGGIANDVMIDCIQARLSKLKSKSMDKEIQDGAPAPKKLKVSKDDRRHGALKKLYPGKIRANQNVSDMKWISDTASATQEPNNTVDPTTVRSDAADVQALLLTTTKRNMVRAAMVISAVLDDKDANPGLKAIVLETIGAGRDTKDIKLYRLIIQGIQECIAHHTNEAGGTRTIAAETLVKNTLTAAAFHIAKGNSKISNSALSDALGATWSQISLARSRAALLVEHKTVVAPYLRNKRSDFIREKVLPFINDYCQDDEYTRLDTKQRVYEWTNPRTDRLSAKYPGRIVLVDRTFILDTKGHKPVNGTTSLHEVRSKATTVPAGTPRVWPLVVSDLMCRCPHCQNDPNNKECQWAPWRRTREVKMEVEKLGVGDIEARSYVGDRVAREVDGVVYHGTVKSFNKKQKTWMVEYDDSDTGTMGYIQLVEAKQLVDAST